MGLIFADSTLSGSAKTMKIGHHENFPLYVCMYVCIANSTEILEHVCLIILLCMPDIPLLCENVCTYNNIIVIPAGGIMSGRRVHSREVAVFKPASITSL